MKKKIIGVLVCILSLFIVGSAIYISVMNEQIKNINSDDISILIYRMPNESDYSDVEYAECLVEPGTVNHDTHKVVAYRISFENKCTFELENVKLDVDDDNLTEENIINFFDWQLTDGVLNLNTNQSVGSIKYFAVPKQLSDDEIDSIIKAVKPRVTCKVLWKNFKIDCHFTDGAYDDIYYEVYGENGGHK